MIVKLEENCCWNGVSVASMNNAELKLILAYKVFELDVAYKQMSDGQRKAVELAMSNVHIPLIVRGGGTA